jgi:hypothetical protein
MLVQSVEAAEGFRRALRLAEVGPEQMHLSRMLERVEARANGA